MYKENNINKEEAQAGFKNVLTLQEVSALTGISKGHLYHLCSQRQIPHYKQGRTYFKRDEVEAWLTSRRIPTQAEINSKAAAYCITH